MLRFAVLCMFVGGFALSMIGCTNTIRGFGKDVHSDHIQNYNSRTASNMD
jgi:predicted small secreted protein